MTKITFVRETVPVPASTLPAGAWFVRDRSDREVCQMLRPVVSSQVYYEIAILDLATSPTIMTGHISGAVVVERASVEILVSLWEKVV